MYRAASGRCASSPGRLRGRTRTRASSSSSPRARRGSRRRSLPTLMGYDSDFPAQRRGRWGCAAWRWTSLRDMEILFDGIPLESRSTTSNDHQRSGGDGVRMYLAVASGRAFLPNSRDDPERHPQEVHRPAFLDLPPGAVDCASSRTSWPTARTRSRSGTRSASAGTTSGKAGSTAVQELAFTIAATGSPTSRRDRRPGSL